MRYAETRNVQKLLVLSTLIAMIAVPLLAARDRSAIRSLKKTALFVAALNALYLLLLLFVYPHLH